MIVFYSKDIKESTALLVDQEAQHCHKVLRKKIGDELFVTDGLGTLYKGIIMNASKSKVHIAQLEVIDTQPTKPRIAIAIAPTKLATRIEWFLEKTTEIGITDIFPIYTKRTERNKLKYERLESIMVSAMKQSKNYHKPILHELQKYPDFVNNCNVEHKYIAHCMDADKHLLKVHNQGDAIVLIGPEGDFTEEEVTLATSNGFQEVNLGDARYRTETAGIVACHLLNLSRI